MNPLPHSVWVTMTEFSRMMGKSRMWASKGIRSGLFAEAGITIICTDRPSGRGGYDYRYYFQVLDDYRVQ